MMSVTLKNGLKLFALMAVLVSLAVPAWAAPSIDNVRQQLNSDQQELNSLGATWQQTRSTMTKGMLLQQISSITSALTSQVSDSVKNAPAGSSAAARQSLLDAMLVILDKQLRQAPTIIRDLFHVFESDNSANQPLTWLTVAVSMDYQTSLYLQKAQILQLLDPKAAGVASQQQRFSHQLKRYGTDLYSFLQASIRQTNQLKGELGNLTKELRNQIEARLLMQQRINHTFSNNLKKLIPLLRAQGIDTTRYNQLTFEATGELSDLIVNSGSPVAFVRSLFDNSDQWLISNLQTMVPRLIVFILLMALFYAISRVMKVTISKMVRSRHSRMSTLVQEFFIATTGKAVMLMGLLVACAQVGLDLGPLLAGLGVAGIVIGFALQDTLSNFASGVMILIYRPFDVGDYVEAGGVAGKVSYMSLVNTTIRTFDNQKFMVPNSKIWGSTIKNITAERVRRVDMEFSISYSDDIELAERLLKEIIEQHPDVLREPEPVIRLMKLNSSSVDFVVRPWTRTEAYWDVYWDVTRTVKMTFDTNGLTIPFPQQDVHLYTENNQRESNK